MCEKFVFRNTLLSKSQANTKVENITHFHVLITQIPQLSIHSICVSSNLPIPLDYLKQIPDIIVLLISGNFTPDIVQRKVVGRGSGNVEGRVEVDQLDDWE